MFPEPFVTISGQTSSGNRPEPKENDQKLKKQQKLKDPAPT